MHSIESLPSHQFQGCQTWQTRAGSAKNRISQRNVLSPFSRRARLLTLSCISTSDSATVKRHPRERCHWVSPRSRQTFMSWPHLFKATQHPALFPGPSSQSHHGAWHQWGQGCPGGGGQGQPGTILLQRNGNMWAPSQTPESECDGTGQGQTWKSKRDSWFWGAQLPASAFGSWHTPELVLQEST